MIPVTPLPGAVGFDTDENVTGFLLPGAFVIRYLEAVTEAECQYILSAGKALGLCTFAEDFDGVAHAAKLASLGYPKGCTVFLDVEGVTLDPVVLIQRIDTWAHTIRAQGYDPGKYHGPQSLLTSRELTALAVDRYWKGAGRTVDRYDVEAAPYSGYCVFQLTNDSKTGDTALDIPRGLVVDVDAVRRDFQGRLPMWARAA